MSCRSKYRRRAHLLLACGPTVTAEAEYREPSVELLLILPDGQELKKGRQVGQQPDDPKVLPSRPAGIATAGHAGGAETYVPYLILFATALVGKHRGRRIADSLA